MEKTIEPNQSMTVNGITINLERVELTAKEMVVYAFYTPPDCSPPQSPRPSVSPYFETNAWAEYRNKAGVSSPRFLDNGIRLFWDNLDPVPSDAKELTFTILSLGDWEGPWEFKIPLE